MDGPYELPEQVLFDILLCLPVMSLLRFKVVCKNWFSLIESPYFVSEHLNRNRDNKEDNLIVLSCVRGQDESYTQKFVLLSGSEYEECEYNIDVGWFWHPTNKVFLTGYCDGIVCLDHWNHLISLLWNPALKQVRTLPPPLFVDRLASSEFKWRAYNTSFGIDVKSNDYKLVKILISDEMCKNQVEVYNMGGDNSWRIIHKDDFLPFSLIRTVAAVSSRKTGKCFWIAIHNDLSFNLKTLILLSFDFGDDAFTTMLLPNDEKHVYSDLDLLDDKVVYFTERTSVNSDRSMEVWILHQFGVETSWSLIYKFEPMSYSLDLIYPRRISKNGEFLICHKFYSIVLEGVPFHKSPLYLYNLHTQQGKYHHRRDIDLMHGQIIHYNPSLLSLKTAKNAWLTM